MREESTTLVERGVQSLPGETWQLAVRRFEILGPIARNSSSSPSTVHLAAAELGISDRHARTLIQRLREGQGVATDLVPRRSSGGQGVSRLPDEVESAIRDEIEASFKRRQRPRASVSYTALELRCLEAGLVAPSRATFYRRIANLSPLSVVQAREGRDAARRLKPAGLAHRVSLPLEQVQIDHTWMDLFVVDETQRRSLGRPYLTLALDVYSRAVVGFLITLEPPSSLSVALCLAQVCCDKGHVVARIGADVDWPMSGVPATLLLDNAAEFHSEALRRGASQYGIELKFRRPGKVEDGGIIERGVKTSNDGTHELPGTTFSNIMDRGQYNSEKEAALTVRELEKWFLLHVSRYHERVHQGTGQSPRVRWIEGLAQSRPPRIADNAKAVLVDFLPVERRKLGRSGLQLDRILYYSDSLRPLIERAKTLDKLVIRRDPTNLSKIWVLDPLNGHYLEVPYKNLDRPPISLHEHRLAVRRLRESARSTVDEEHIFRMVKEMRELVDGASKTTKGTRRNQARRPQTPSTRRPAVALAPIALSAPDEVERVQRFERIEKW